MVLNQEENLVLGVKFDNGCSKEEFSDMVGQNSNSEKGSEDIVHVLPNDPFGMDFNKGFTGDAIDRDVNLSLPKDPFDMNFGTEATVSAINDWVEDFSLKICAVESDEEGKIDDDEKLIGELNLVWESSMQCELEEGEKENVDGDEADSVIHVMDESTFDECHLMVGSGENLMCLGFEKYQKEHVEDSCNEAEGGAPPDALFFALGYLGVWDLLSVERVCKSLRDAVQNDPLLWRKFQIDYPLCFNLFDDDLLRLTNRAQGSLDTLSLINCKKVTNFGLKHVLESNLRLTKLSLRGCDNLNVDIMLQDLRIFNSLGIPGIKNLRISDHLGITNHHLKEFKLLLGVGIGKKAGSYKPRFYGEGHRYLSLDDERAIDIELCPKCNQVSQVYDCPSKSCQVKPGSTQACKACIACVDRCIKCGCCLDNMDYEETFCLDLICLDCLTQLLDCEGRMRFFPTHTYFAGKTGYHIVFCG
ncbi:Ribonuclease inhibitor isoform 1 [Dorcoceras hygrometricum]|uniref:Ribonuclease inhibitor isoform 1 n=1 Tax=Dorcoceras hygrometricum TaxID=472368 RepID=A0A2Z7AEC7_9LAMI|nr:Ribonuclease inhibitor isoform 1 [Dorcoceras hygrometricum]